MEEIESIIKQVKNGDMECFDEIIKKYQQGIFIYCLGLLGQVQEAEDATQDVFFKAYEKIYSYKYSESFRAWLYKIAHNCCISVIRRKRIISFVPFINNDNNVYIEEGRFEEYGLSQELQEALKKLSPEDRGIVLLKVLGEKSYDELSDIFCLKSAVLRKRYERAKKKLIANLSKEKGEYDHEKYGIHG